MKWPTRWPPGSRRCGAAETVTPAGKNFASFDRQFLKRLPEFEKLVKLHHRTLDPAMLYWQVGDEKLPDSKTCYERAGMDPKVAHTALEDALAVVRLIRTGVKHLRRTLTPGERSMPDVTPSQQVQNILAELAARPATTLAQAHARLQGLLTALRESIDEKWASTDDKQAVLADVSVRVEAVEAVMAALADLEKAEAAATATVERIWKKLYAARTEQPVWRKLMPA